MKFKKGDRVKILPSASFDGIHEGDLGRDAVVTDNRRYDSMYVRMVSPRPGDNRGWWVSGCNLEHVIKAGQQLMFQFMSDFGER